MPWREYYTVDRKPEEVQALWNWAKEECRGKIEHENPYAMGILAAMEYLMGETEELPQYYKGKFTLNNILRQSEKSENIRTMCEACVNEPLDNDFHSLRPGNPKCFLYDAPLIGGDIAGNQGGVNQGGDAVGRDTNNG